MYFKKPERNSDNLEKISKAHMTILFILEILNQIQKLSNIIEGSINSSNIVKFGLVHIGGAIMLLLIK